MIYQTLSLQMTLSDFRRSFQQVKPLQGQCIKIQHISPMNLMPRIENHIPVKDCSSPSWVCTAAEVIVVAYFRFLV